MEPNQSIHIPVLLHEIVSGLGHPQRYLDGTLGGAGHALAIAKAMKGKLTIVGLDRDPRAILRAGDTLKDAAEKIILENQDYRHLDSVLDKHEIAAVDGILFDLGISSDELDNSGRGFTFLKDEPLLMTMGDPTNHTFTARDIVNTWEEETIADVIFGYGEERYARRIAKAIVIYRDKKKIETSGELCEIIKMSVPPVYRRGKIHPATRTFQALRITVNDELNALRDGLKKGYERLAPHGRLAVISFHSLEDRIVKDFNKERVKEGATVTTKKPITASPEEIATNPRSRSAKLRILIKS
jgi:16S rRNA (cytosine1402-N4)-methyltransferase